MSERNASTGSIWRAAMLLVGIIVLVRVAMMGIYILEGHWTWQGPTDRDWWTGTDGYVRLARNMVQTGRFAFHPDVAPSVHRAPAFPAAIAASYWLTGSYVWGTIALNLVCSAVTSVISLAFARRFYTNRVAWGVALVAALHPALVRYTASSFSDIFLTMSFTLYAFTTLLALERRRTWLAVGSGAAYALTLLTKSILLPLPAILIPLALLFRRQWLRPIAIQIAVAAVLVAPWAWRNYQLIGRPALVVGGGFNLLVGNFMASGDGTDCNNCFHTAVRDALDDVEAHSGEVIDLAELRSHGHLDIRPEQDKVFFERAVQQLRDDPGFAVRKVVVNLGRFWYFASTFERCAVLAAINLPLLALAIWELCRRRRDHGHDFLWLAILLSYVCLIYAAIIVHSRFYFVAMPMLGPLAAGRMWYCFKRAEPVGRPATDAATSRARSSDLAEVR